MNHQAFTNESLTMMYEAVRGALAADDSLEGLGEEPKFKSATRPNGKPMQPTSRLKCSNEECLST